MNEQNSISTLEPLPKAPSPSGNLAAAPAPAISPAPPAESWLAWMQRAGPMVLVLALLGCFAYLGHRTGWTVPKFAELFGATNSAKDDWCEAHSVPESLCVECNDALMPKVKTTWCRKHGIHNCPFERPEVAQTMTTPTISQEDLDRAQRALDLKDRKENNSKCKLHERRIQFASLDVINKNGSRVFLARVP